MTDARAGWWICWIGAGAASAGTAGMVVTVEGEEKNEGGL